MARAPRLQVGAILAMSTLIVAACSGSSTDKSAPNETTTSTAPSIDSTTIPTVVDTTEPPIEVPDDFTLGGFGFFDVSEMSVADERGSGCGVGGEAGLPDVLPDGLWFGSLGPKYEYYEPVNENELGYGYARFDAGSLELDVWCVYAGETAASKYLSEQCQADVECEANNSTGWLVEDIVDRLHQIPVAEEFSYRVDDYDAEAGWSCGLTDSFGADGFEPAWRLLPVWIAVNSGVVTEVFGHCAYYLEASRDRT
ncbi:MAG: hypothetical protein ACO3DM_09255 [Ilumatobacteraceae bacterium]|jgi:hypothetical protein